jgi:D-alanyl-D-alanine carboxypeptidase
VAAAERDGLRLVTVILGAPTEAFSQAAAVLDHGFTAYERRTVIAEGQAVDPVEVDGQMVPAAAGAPIDALLSRGQPVDLEVRPEAGLELPVDAGEPLGVVEAIANGELLGESPVLAATTVRRSAPDGEEEPWWERTLEAVGRFFVRMARAIFG